LAGSAERSGKASNDWPGNARSNLSSSANARNGAELSAQTRI